MGRKSRSFPFLLFLVLLSAACTSQSLQPEETAERKEEPKTAGSTEKKTEKELVYQGENIPLPGENSGNYRIEETKDGIVLTQLAFNRQENASFSFLYQDGVWQDITPDFLRGGQEWGEPAAYTEDEESIWLLFWKKQQAEDPWKQTVVVYDKKTGAYRESGLILPESVLLRNIGVLSDGSLLLFDSGNFEAYVYRKGEQEYSCRFYAGGGSGWLDLGDGVAAVRMTPSKGYTAVRVSTGEMLKEEVPAELFAGDVMAYSRFYRDEKADYVAGCNGIFRKERGEQGDWQQVVSAEETVLFDPDVRLRDFLPDKEGGFYLLLEDGLWHYTPKVIRKAERETLQILSLYPEKEVKKRVIAFQSVHPQIQVEYKTCLPRENASAEEEAEAVEKLSAGLLAGITPDFLVLDGLPWESYAEKGLLLDLQPGLQDILKDDDFLGAVIAGCRQSDGKLYAAVTGFTPIFLTLREGVPESVNTLDGLQDFLKEDETRTGFLPSVYSDRKMVNLSRCLYRLYGTELFDKQGKWIPEKGRQYLKIWKQIHDRVERYDGLNTDAAPLSGYEFVKMIKRREGDFAVGHGDSPALLMPEKLGGYSVISSGKYIAWTKVGIWADTGHRESAEEFLRQMLLSQKEDGENYYSVCKSAVVRLKKTVAGRCLSMYGESYTEIQEDGFAVINNTPEDIPRVIELYQEFAIPVRPENELYRLIFEQFQPCLQGEQDFDKAWEAVNNAVLLYQEEHL